MPPLPSVLWKNGVGSGEGSTAMLVDVGIGLSVGMGVGVPVGVGVSVGSAAGVYVGVGAGGNVGVPVGSGVNVGVGGGEVLVALGVTVLVAVDVTVGVSVGVAVSMSGVKVAEADVVESGLGSGVGRKVFQASEIKGMYIESQIPKPKSAKRLRCRRLSSLISILNFPI